MTDTTVAADTGSAPDTSTPAVSEVPVNPSPTSAPSPLGPQAPQAPTGDVKGSEHHPKSARETIQDAYNRALNPPKPQRPAAKEPAKEPAKAAEAKPGHNKPPEKTEADKPLNLKKRPDDQEQPQPRGDHGRFAPRQETVADNSSLSAAGGDGAVASRPAPSPLPHDAPFREPPTRMADHAKREWATVPESVRGEVHRMHREFEQAYGQYKGAAEAFAPVAHFHQMAQQQGTTLQQALDHFVSMEQKLRADPVAGLDLIVHNLDLTDPETNQRIGLRDIAYHVLTQTPDQLRTLQQGNSVNAVQHQMGALHQQIASLTNALQQMQYNQQYGNTRSALDVFADSPGHERFDELAATIDLELKSGYDLETAYRRAELLNPATPAAQTRTQSAQTRETSRDPDRSISGAPGGGANGATQLARRGEPRSIRDAVEHATRRVSNGF